jgi:hypothetical protein
MTDTETLTQLRADIDAADCMLGDASGLLRALQRFFEQYDPERCGDNLDLTSTDGWHLLHVIQEKVAAASELINPSTFEPADQARESEAVV